VPKKYAKQGAMFNVQDMNIYCEWKNWPDL